MADKQLERTELATMTQSEALRWGIKAAIDALEPGDYAGAAELLYEFMAAEKARR